MNPTNRRIRTALYAFGIFWGLVIVLPFFWLATLSVKSRLDAFATPPKLLFTPTFEAYREVFTDSDFLSAIMNSLIVSTGAVVLSLVIAIPAAFALRNLTGPIRHNALLTILLIRMVPGMVYLLPYFVIYGRLDLIDTRIGLIIVHLIFNVPLIIWMLTPIWRAIPRDLAEAARVDGATPLQTLLLVDLPLLKGGILASSVLAFIFSWNEFLFALVLTRRDVVTLPVAIVNFLAFEGTEWGKIAAASMFIVIPAIVFGFFVRRYMIAGLTGGAVKG
ncbi:multiple sugar transport system permease protein [Palleronia aestuarii]|uniref:Multiple sugar transport system permease protein n=1 Tax=Palleronia aestuarii TaxID=568105 RepID=A0A2W7NK80_9RHOB|nr:carbohydrate ABC transporter permease [Palleronia aestuarii]PZX13596.1 multiple sugar transport system permease protein [Palleronia aestuarii]